MVAPDLPAPGAAGPPDAPARLAELWEAWDRPAPVAKEGLSVHRITEAAVAIADADGLGSVSMARVAKRLGCTPMALYRHVAGKDELLLLMLNSVIEPFPPLPDDVDWRTGLESWTTHLARNFRRSPWAVDVNPTGLNTPGQWEMLEAGLRILSRTSLPDEEKAAVLLVLSAQVFSDIRLLTQMADTDMGQAFSNMFADPRFVERYPETGRAIAAGVFDQERDDGSGADHDPIDLELGVRLVLDGLAVRIAELAGS